MNKKLYLMKLFEIMPVEINDSELWTSVMRVPGGWVFRSFDKSNKMMSTCYVPYHNEFQE
jgi:hypothetical protein